MCHGTTPGRARERAARRRVPLEDAMRRRRHRECLCFVEATLHRSTRCDACAERLSRGTRATVGVSGGTRYRRVYCAGCAPAATGGVAAPCPAATGTDDVAAGPFAGFGAFADLGVCAPRESEPDTSADDPRRRRRASGTFRTAWSVAAEDTGAG